MKTILIIEDDPDIRELLTYNLGSRGNEITGVGTAEEALALLPDKSFDLALVDLMLPGMSGIEFCRLVRRHKTRERMMLVMLTASDCEEDVVAALDGGVDEYLCKPFSMNELSLRVQTILDRRDAMVKHLEADMVEWVRGGVHHCLNQPLTAMFSNLFLLEKTCKNLAGQNGLVQEALAGIRTAAMRMDELVRFLAHTREIHVADYPGGGKVFNLEAVATGDRDDTTHRMSLQVIDA